MIVLIIFIITTYIIKFSIYLCSKFFFPSRTTLCFADPDDLFPPPQLLRISESTLYSQLYYTSGAVYEGFCRGVDHPRGKTGVLVLGPSGN
jgi:hypothetical protein